MYQTNEVYKHSLLYERATSGAMMQPCRMALDLSLEVRFPSISLPSQPAGDAAVIVTFRFSPLYYIQVPKGLIADRTPTSRAAVVDARVSSASSRTITF